MSDWKKDWKEKLTDVDDDYLIGISNKGIVKRAYKDKEASAAQILDLGGEAAVKVGEGSVTVCYPLGESKCSCPSHSICRHVIQAILTLREEVAKEDVQKEQTSYKAQNEAAEQGTMIEQGEAAGQGKTAAQGEITEQGKNAAQTETPPQTKDSAKVCEEIDKYPLSPLKKALGNRQFQNFVNQVTLGVKPEIQYASVVTVRIPNREEGAQTVVKLLSPLEYSSCTCHKKELCAHKAAAILWCQLESGALAKETLADEAANELSYDMDKIKDAAGQMKQFLEELLGTGLSRTSSDVLDYVERLAVISHNAGLAKFEGYFRALFDSYDSYFKRKASFQPKELMGQITRLYRRVELLLSVKDNTQIRQYAGEFRAEYIPVGRLDLIGIAVEHFSSQTGYEGETVYFLEEHTKKWYTYTSARPVFYEKAKKRKFTQKGQAPWGLAISLEELAKVRIRLDGAKCDGRRRLSASQDTKGELKGEQKLSLSDIEGWYYKDFGELFLQQIGKLQKEWLADGASQEAAELVFVQPAECEKAVFSHTGQKLSLPLYDTEKREVTVEVTYSREESATIRYLERISDKKPPCFVGKIYLRDGKMQMYPVAVQYDLNG